MAAPTEPTTDRGVGLSLVLGALAVFGAGVMFATAPEETAGWGFAAAVTFGALAVVAVHLYWN